jgi:hypothetical protein
MTNKQSKKFILENVVTELDCTTTPFTVGLLDKFRILLEDILLKIHFFYAGFEIQDGKKIPKFKEKKGKLKFSNDVEFRTRQFNQLNLQFNIEQSILNNQVFGAHVFLQNLGPNEKEQLEIEKVRIRLVKSLIQYCQLIENTSDLLFDEHVLEQLFEYQPSLILNKGQKAAKLYFLDGFIANGKSEYCYKQGQKHDFEGSLYWRWPLSKNAQAHLNSEYLPDKYFPIFVYYDLFRAFILSYQQDEIIYVSRFLPFLNAFDFSFEKFYSFNPYAPLFLKNLLFIFNQNEFELKILFSWGECKDMFNFPTHLEFNSRRGYEKSKYQVDRLGPYHYFFHFQKLFLIFQNLFKYFPSLPCLKLGKTCLVTNKENQTCMQFKDFSALFDFQSFYLLDKHAFYDYYSNKPTTTLVGQNFGKIQYGEKCENYYVVDKSYDDNLYFLMPPSFDFPISIYIKKLNYKYDCDVENRLEPKCFLIPKEENSLKIIGFKHSRIDDYGFDIIFDGKIVLEPSINQKIDIDINSFFLNDLQNFCLRSRWFTTISIYVDGGFIYLTNKTNEKIEIKLYCDDHFKQYYQKSLEISSINKKKETKKNVLNAEESSETTNNKKAKSERIQTSGGENSQSRITRITLTSECTGSSSQ